MYDQFLLLKIKSGKMLHVHVCVTNSVPIFHSYMSFISRDAKFFNIAVDAEKKKQLELELQVFALFMQL